MSRPFNARHQKGNTRLIVNTRKYLWDQVFCSTCWSIVSFCCHVSSWKDDKWFLANNGQNVGIFIEMVKNSWSERKTGKRKRVEQNQRKFACFSIHKKREVERRREKEDERERERPQEWCAKWTAFLDKWDFGRNKSGKLICHCEHGNKNKLSGRVVPENYMLTLKAISRLHRTCPVAGSHSVCHKSKTFKSLRTKASHVTSPKQHSMPLCQNFTTLNAFVPEFHKFVVIQS